MRRKLYCHRGHYVDREMIEDHRLPCLICQDADIYDAPHVGARLRMHKGEWKRADLGSGGVVWRLAEYVEQDGEPVAVLRRPRKGQRVEELVPAYMLGGVEPFRSIRATRRPDSDDRTCGGRRAYNEARR